MTHGTFPRQPRSGTVDNAVRTVAHSAMGYTGVECTSANGTWFEVAQFEHASRARNLRDQLRTMLARPGADLEFVHATRLVSTGNYAVVWPTVTWSRADAYTTSVGNCPAGTPYTTSERLYQTSPLLTLTQVLKQDVAHYGLHAHEIAFLWTNNLRFALHGWNATKDAMASPIAGGTVPLLPEPKNWRFAPVKRAATRYGYGECQPNFTTANGEIFHTMDLLVAAPGNAIGQAAWARNQWVRITYKARSTVARMVDVCGCTHLDLSRGLATYLGFPGSGKVMVSKP